MAQKTPQRPKPRPLNEGSSKGNTRNVSNAGRQAPPPPPPKPRTPTPPKR